MLDIIQYVKDKDPNEREFHQACLEAAEQYGSPGNYVVGANIAGFTKVVNAMLDQGLV